jgi:hypothetical protein
VFELHEHEVDFVVNAQSERERERRKISILIRNYFLSQDIIKVTSDGRSVSRLRLAVEFFRWRPNGIREIENAKSNQSIPMNHSIKKGEREREREREKEEENAENARCAMTLCNRAQSVIKFDEAQKA